MKNNKSNTNTYLFAICALVLSSCSIIRGLKTDGKYGPDIFSFEKREVDTIANGDYTFQFPVGKRADWIDTTHFANAPHPCEYMTFLEAFTKESTTQGLLVIHNDSIVMVRIGLHNHGYTRIPVLFEQMSGPWPVVETK